ncbi:hypothetical protein E2C01_038861 [Portunus trituberculatus]|uniref:Uncharacterized protein n=1 Tax=Portunus trituberculatus TaxID=210409 RepID=A0A5B7FD93_PORTR|nr:hypothetical protein [Portunus trituberculatus]
MARLRKLSAPSRCRFCTNSCRTGKACRFVNIQVRKRGKEETARLGFCHCISAHSGGGSWRVLVPSFLDGNEGGGRQWPWLGQEKEIT